MTDQDIAQMIDQAHACLDNNQINEAKSLFSQICEIDDNNAEAWMMLGAINGQTGLASEALSCLQKATRIQPDYADAHLTLAHIQLEQGDLDDALLSAEKATTLDPEYAEAWLLLGAIAGRNERLDIAESASRRALELMPDSVDAHVNLAGALHRIGQFSDAESSYRNALAINPELAEVNTNLGNVLMNQDKDADAETALNKAVSIAPSYAPAHANLGSLYLRQGKLEAAVSALDKAVELAPDVVDYRKRLAYTLEQYGKPQEALDCLKTAISLDPADTALHYQIGAVQEALGLFGPALESYQEAARLEPALTEATAAQASVYDKMGQQETARTTIKSITDGGQIKLKTALVLAQLSSDISERIEAIEHLEYLALDGQVPAPNRAEIHFALGNLYEQNNQYEKAFENFERANTLKSTPYDPTNYSEYIDHLITIFTPDTIASIPSPGSQSDRPIFIVGMPRSGTSLVEQVLASHPSVLGGGELPAMHHITESLCNTGDTGMDYPDCVPHLSQKDVDTAANKYLEQLDSLSEDSPRITDKMPYNFHHLGLIHALFPNARIINCTRNPLDTCLSCYFHDFSGYHPYAYNLSSLGSNYSEYQRLMDHWKTRCNIPVLDLSYENMVNNFEQTSRELIEYCGLEWDDNCLRFYENPRSVATASYKQVRRPVYSTAVDRWKHYEEHLDALKTALGMSS